MMHGQTNIKFIWPNTELPQTKGLKERSKAVPGQLLANSGRKTKSRFIAVVVVNISLFLEKFFDPLAARVMIIKSYFPEDPAARGHSLVRGPPNM